MPALPPHPFLTPSIRLPIEQTISAYLSYPWSITSLVDLRDYACHPAAILKGNFFSAFVKFSDSPNAQHQFEVEQAGLNLLHQLAGVQTPTIIAILSVDSGTLMIQQAVQSIERGPAQWRQIGQALGHIHMVKGQSFGFHSQGYFGPLYQDNRPLSTWSSFFVERRLYPRLMTAIDSGNLPSTTIRQLEQIIARVPTLLGTEPTPTLLHGDAQKNNYISTSSGAVVIDPAVHYGHPEFDLAYVDYFEPVPENLWQGYREVLPLAPDFAERRDLYRLYGYLAIVSIEGASWLGTLTAAMQRYL